MKKRVSLFVMVLVAACFNQVTAQVRTPEEIRQIALGYFSTATKSSRSNQADPLLRTIPAREILNQSSSGAAVKSGSAEAFYVCVGESGFVIVSGDHRMVPVLGYSDGAGFEIRRVPIEMYGLLSGYATVFDALQGFPVRYETEPPVREADFPPAVSSLLDRKGIAWAQEEPYNDLCPVINGRRSVTGCVATAMAMVMMYHEYPSRGKGELGDFHLEQEPFDWEGMKNMNTVTGRQGVARLMRFCGLAVGSTYGLLETTAPAQNILKALDEYFGYSSGMRYVSRHALLTAEWNDLMKREISQGRPVTYSGYAHDSGGHCFVLDGYDLQDLFHINWGWGGGFNGFYTLTALRPGFSGPGSSMGGYNVGQGAIIGIQPAAAEEGYVSNFSGINSSLVLNKQRMPRNADFDISRMVYANYATLFTGDIQPALFKGDQLVSTLGSPIRATRIQYLQSPGEISFSHLTIPPAIPDGVYQLRMVSKDVRESGWQPVRMSQTGAPYYGVSVAGSEVAFLNPVNMNGLSMTLFERENSMYERFGVGFKMTIFNSGSEWMGNVGVQMQVADESKEPVVVARDRSVFLSGENSFQLLEMALPLTKGEYVMQPVYSVNGVHWFPLSGSKKERVLVEEVDYNGFNLVLKAYKPVRMTLTEKDRAQFELTIQNSGTGPFHDRIRIEIFNKKNPGLSYRIPDKEVFIDKNQSVSFVLEYLQHLPDGDYLVNVQYLHFMQGAKMMGESICGFTVRSLSFYENRLPLGAQNRF